LQRTLQRSDNNKFEQKSLDFHLSVYNKYKEIIALNTTRIVSLSCQEKSPAMIQNEIISVLNKRYEISK
jgi:thymidylate kinase